MKFKALFLAAVIASLSFCFTGCGDEKSVGNVDSSELTDDETEDETETEEKSSEPSESELALKNAIKTYGLPQLEEPEYGETIATIETNKGDITVRFFEDIAPLAVENFITHAQEGYYDGVIFHRVINDFMIQGGDPTGTGTGGESIYGEDFGLETSPALRHFRGALAMANTGQENSNGSQFYIVQQTDIGDYKAAYEEALGNQDEVLDEETGIVMSDVYPTEVLNEYISNGGSPYLDFNYTVFGQVIDGMDVVDAIAAVETDENDKPVEDVVIKDVKVSEYGL